MIIRYFLDRISQVLGLVGGGLFAVSAFFLSGASHKAPGQEMEVALPRFIQVSMAAGDRYLAANLAGFRVLVAETQNMKTENYQIQARLQQDIAWFNPGHQDNYYIANALLPWNGQLDAAQDVLLRAIEGRPNDWSPIFYYAFNIYFFHHDPVLAARWLLEAAKRCEDENDKMVLENLAAKWFEKGYQPGVAAGVVEAMAQQSRSSGFRKYLQQRAQRIRDLAMLQDAAEKYVRLGKGPLDKLDKLVDAGILKMLPIDPFGMGYGVDSQGRPILFNTPQLARK